MQFNPCLIAIWSCPTILSALDDCIHEPGAYKELFQQVQWNFDAEPRCVDRGLMVSLVGPYSHLPGACPRNPAVMADTVDAYNGSYWGWVSGSPNLEEYLLIAQNHTGDPFATTADMLRFVGFTEDDISEKCSYSMAVFTSRRAMSGNGLMVPTWAELFLQLSVEPFYLDLDWDVQKELAQRGFLDFDSISGCQNRTVCTGGKEESCTCGEEYITTYTTLQHKFEECGTICCVLEFANATNNGEDASVAAARAFFQACLAANPFFTGLGYSYDGTTVTVPEYLVRNVKLGPGLDAVVFEVYSPSAPLGVRGGDTIGHVVFA